MARYRQPQTEAASGPSRAALELAEAVEDIREKRRFDPLTGVDHGDHDMRAMAFETDRDLSSSGREFDGVRQKVPDDLLQTVGVPRHEPRRRIDIGNEFDILGVSRRASDVYRGLDDRGQRDQARIEAQFARNNARDIQ